MALDLIKARSWLERPVLGITAGTAKAAGLTVAAAAAGLERSVSLVVQAGQEALGPHRLSPERLLPALVEAVEEGQAALALVAQVVAEQAHLVTLWRLVVRPILAGAVEAVALVL